MTRNLQGLTGRTGARVLLVLTVCFPRAIKNIGMLDSYLVLQIILRVAGNEKPKKNRETR